MCTKPIEAFQLKQQYWVNPDQAPQPVFRYPLSPHRYNKLPLPCGKCIACVKVHTMGRAIQMDCELQTNIENGYLENFFLTTSYSDEHIATGHTLVKEDHTNYIKRLRQWRVRNSIPGKFRYEHKAEYGLKTFRPHNHYAMFNLGDIPDLEVWEKQDDYTSYTSKTMQDIWGMGRVIIIPLTLPACIYIAQHVNKKIGNSPMHERMFYDQKTGLIIPPPPDREIINKKTGEIEIIKGRVPEYPTQSNRPGIGSDWFDKYHQSDLQTNSIVPQDMREHKMPAYFYKKLKEVDPHRFEVFKLQNEIYAIKNQRTKEENAYQELFDIAQLKQKKTRTKV